jgi:surface antigen
MTAPYADKPTSDWPAAHAVATDDVLIDTETGDRLRVEEVRGDGSITVLDMSQGGAESYSEREVRDALRDGILETEAAGLSESLAAY